MSGLLAVRDLVSSALLLLFMAGAAWAQEAGDWRARYAQGEEARQAGDHAVYAREMAASAEAMPPGHLNRPWVQYHAARAHALAGDGESAVAWLDRMWEEEIEALMLTFAAHDPAFDGMRDDPALGEILGRAGNMTLDVEHLGGRVHRIGGAGSNVVASVGEDGVLLVDTGYGPALPALRSALASLGDARVEVLLLTHPHEDHWGAAAGLGEEATVLAHPATATAMGEPYEVMDGLELDPKPDHARPDRTVTDTAFTFNGEEVRVHAFPSHTEGDLAVYFSGAGVLHMGDLYLSGNPMMYPGGEDPEGFLDRMGSFLGELPEDTRVVAGHDAGVTLDDVLGQVAESQACMAMVEEALAEGLEMEAVVERAEGRFPAPWIGFFYRALSAEGGG